MQLRTVIERRRRKWTMIVLGVVAFIAAVWVLRYVTHQPTDEEKYQAVFRSWDRAMGVASFRRSHKFPLSFDKVFLRLQMRSAKRSADLSTELQASGYVAQFLVTNDNPDILVLTNEQVAPPY